LIDPLILDQNINKDAMGRLDIKLKSLTDRIFTLEDILFEKDDAGRM
jgi:hypothetical protein